MENKRNLIYLAALLHDIGKFYQRADEGGVSKSIYLSDINKNEGTFCPVYDGKYSHKHVLWTAQFIDDFQSVFKNLIQQTGENIENDTLLKLAASHHLSSTQLTELGKTIKEADCLSSGMDREKDSDFIDDQDIKGWDAFKKKRMVSILESINGTKSQNPHHLPVKAMTLSKDSFPKLTFDEYPDYKKLWELFVGEFKFIQSNTYRAFSETLLNLLSKYASTIPASTMDFPDVSLYDHLKTTAAIAVCLYDYNNSEKKSENPFLLIGSDISGIQPYIYQVVSKHAGKNLKGRSFYIRLLSDTIVRFLLKKLKLYQANVVYNSGGGFYIIAPNTVFIKDKLEEAIKEIEQKIFNSHNTSLFVAIDFIELSKNALMHSKGENLGNSWNALFEKRDQKKMSKLANYIKDNYAKFFEPSLEGGDTKRDIITGEEFLPKEKQIKFIGETQFIKPITWQQIELGKILKSTDFIVVAEEPIPYWKDKTPIEPVNLGFTYYFINEKDLKDKANELKSSADKVSVITLNGENGSCNFLQTVNGINNIYGLEFYGGNDFETANFEKMCTEANFSRLGVLRLDVDNLGAIFQKGISPERATLSRYSALSRSFDYFFSGYLNTIWRDIEPKKSYIIYSGGDDVFIIGSWEVTIEIAKRIRSDFKEFTCNNPAFSLSGGLAIVPAKFPIMKAAEKSDDEEKSAKAHKAGKAKKNSFSFMEMPLNWDSEFPAVEQLKNAIVELIDQKKILNNSFISKILLHHSNAVIKNNVITNIRTYWLITYDLSRLKAREKQNEINALIDNCITEVCGNKKQLNGLVISTNYHALALWAFAARWAELELRKNK
ncbi:MAG: type III-A CRISPR-associated protein Cas10/Csm1 [Bacteroidales bacterium]|nr:type III-A CRISPR-associated protein Cas10/Csm1 [Bacteroidales bacterium]